MRFLVVGAGYWGPNIVRNLLELPDVESVAVSDVDPARAEKLAKRFPRTTVASQAPLAFADRYDAVCIVTPVALHAQLATDALLAGSHVFIEKPMTRTSAEARSLISLADRLDRRLMVGHVFHYKPSVRKLVNLARSGELGEIRYLDSVRVNLGIFRPDVNVLWDLAPHDLTIFEAIMGRAPKRVAATGACHVRHPVTPQETIAYLTLDYGDECIGHVHVNWYSPMKSRLMMIGGDKKMAVYDDIHPTEAIRVYDHGTYEPEKDTPYYATIRTGDINIPNIKENEEPLKIQLREFIASIREHRKPETDGQAGLRLVETLEAATTSLKGDGGFVEVG
jgi:predicted dehydrogenase